MADQTSGNTSAGTLKEVSFYVLLLGLAFIFFAAVRNNSFWHSSDYLYLLKQLKAQAALAAVRIEIDAYLVCHGVCLSVF